MKQFLLIFRQMRVTIFLPMVMLIGSIPHNTYAVTNTTLHTPAKKGFLARIAASAKRLFSFKKTNATNNQPLSIRNDLLDLIDMLDLDDELIPHLESFKVFVNGIHVPPETEEIELTDVPHSSGTPCKISIVVPAATLLAILQNKLFISHKTYISNQIRTYISKRPLVKWLSRRFGGQKHLIAFLTKYAKAQVVFSYQIDTHDLNRNGELSILTIIASKKYEWTEAPPTIIPRWRPLRTIELVFHDSYIENL